MKIISQIFKVSEQYTSLFLLDNSHTWKFWFQVSTDQSVVDLEMATKLGWCAFSVIQIIGTIAVMSQVAWQVFVIFIPVTGVCVWYQVCVPLVLVGLT